MNKILQSVASFVLMLAFLYWAFRGLDAASVWEATRSASLYWLLGVVGLIVVTNSLRAWRWVVLMRPVTSQVTTFDATLALAMCYSANVVIPRSGEAVRAISLKGTRGVSISAIMGTIVVERVIDLLCLIICIAISAALIPGRIEALFPWMRAAATATLAACIAMLAVILVVTAYGEKGLAIVQRLVSSVSTGLADRVVCLLSQFVDGLSAVRTPRAYTAILLSSFLLNAGYIVIVHWMFLAFGFDRSPYEITFVAAIVIMAVSTIGVIIPTPGGAGSYHYFFGYSLTVLFGIPAAPAMACATVAHALGTLTYLAMGVPAFILRHQVGWSGAGPTEAHGQQTPESCAHGQGAGA